MDECRRVENAVDMVLSELPCSVALPAGTGKTELIAAAVAEVARCGGTSLVLTHTHAGVDALRQRMQKFDVSGEQVFIRTIDSWSYDLIAHFPDLAGIAVTDAPDWTISDEYHRAAARAARSRAMTRMLGVSYTHLFVDEYQDCLIDQHELVVAVGKTIPTAVFGDPLQSLFNFGKNLPVDWDSGVVPIFPAVKLDYSPRRWEPNHKALGSWLIMIRKNLINGEPIDLTTAPVSWVRRADYRSYVRVCLKALQLNGSVAALGQYRSDCVKAAGSLKGTYSVMEALDSEIPMALAEKIDTGEGPEIAAAVVDFTVGCSTGMATHISSAKRKQLAEGRSFTTRKTDLQPAYESVLNVRSDPSPATVRRAMDMLRGLPEVSVYCREAWEEVTTSVAIAGNDGCTVTEALHQLRNRSRAVGRRPAARVVSRPLLVKGLEFDHVIILNPERYSAQELYVALTRGSKTVTVMSDSAHLAAPRMAVRSSVNEES